MGDPQPAFLGEIYFYMVENYLPLGPEDWTPSTTGTYTGAANHDDEPI